MPDQQIDMTDPLGRLIASDAWLRPSRAFRLLTFGLATTLAVAAAGLLARSTAGPWWTGTLTVVSLALFGLGWRIQMTGGIDLYQRGLIWIRGRRRQTVYWSDIREVYRVRGGAGRRWGSKRRWHCRLVRHRGRTLRLDRIEGLGSLSTRIQSQVTRCQLPSARETLRAGHPIRFGSRLTLSREGLQVDRQFLPWHAVREIALDEGRGLRIRSSSDRPHVIHLSASEVPNLELLGSLLEEIRKQITSSRSSDNRAVELEADTLVPSEGERDPGSDPSDLLLAGYDWEDIRTVLQGECSLDELLSRGPRRRPRHPR